jgi:TRAP-type mannitol/chloroaromatic compound transport system permease large subunit
MIVYGVAAEVSIAKLFIAGVLPGMMLALLFSGYIAVWALPIPARCRRRPRPDASWQKLRLAHLIPGGAADRAVLGSIYAGIATATEAAAVGVVGSLVISAAQGSLSWQTFTESLMGATRLYCMIALILAGAAFLTLSMGYIGLPRHLAEWIASLGLTPFGSCCWPGRVLHRAGLLPGRHLHGGADHGRDPAHRAGRRHRPDLVRHLHRAGGRDGADHAAGGLQPVCAAGHDG